MALLYEDKVKENKEDFLREVRSVADSLNKIDPNSLMAVMNSESGLNHKAVNPKGGATGLIQFMPDTAVGLGTTTAELKAMTNVQQLAYVKKYFENVNKANAKKGIPPIKTYYDLYTATFYPAMVGKPDSYVIGSERSPEYAKKVASQNPAIDLGKKGYITHGDFKTWIKSRMPSSAVLILERGLETAKRHKGLVAIAVILIILAVLMIVYRKKIATYLTT